MAREARGGTLDRPRRQEKVSGTLLGRFTQSEIAGTFERLARQRALPTLVRGALSLKLLRRLLRDAIPYKTAPDMPDEVWGSLAVNIALEAPVFGLTLADALHDHLGWDREPEGGVEAWWPAVTERPLEALWNAALSSDKALRKEFAHIARHCLQNFRESPECLPPSWEFFDAVLDIHARQQRELRDAERRAEDGERRLENERERLEELREELKRLRRENAELRTEKAQAERRAEGLARGGAPQADDERRLRELDRRARKAEKERDHLWAQLERLRSAESERAAAAARPEADEPEAASAAAAEPTPTVDVAATPLSADPNPRRRVIRQMLRKLVKKGKIGAAHTHEDNVYRGVADHEKGIAKDAMDLLYREGLFLPKPTVADPHVSIAPERVAEVQALIAGRVDNARLQRFCEE